MSNRVLCYLPKLMSTSDRRIRNKLVDLVFAYRTVMYYRIYTRLAR